MQFWHRVKWDLYGQIKLMIPHKSQGCHIWKMIFFQVREKSGNFLDDQGNLERT